ncbi:AraC family transcriptional regulator [Acidaminobacter sp. JC074]|uniref:AraC family transcriptional regulator n=1 Tax=Acidaminobacter sp. JC074 TaxID=2530199 RepID=UPI001F0CF73C|nr:AraC family transcriptional regulator [Acidaminobacter sp. JC074]MCH4885967.1 AraC family transcriptional regulator [Acidaminobacter sp. JC074]
MRKQYFSNLNDTLKQLPIYVSCTGHNFKETGIKRPKGYPEYQWIQSHKGSGYVEVKGEQFILKENMGMFLLKDEAHNYWPIDDWTTDFITFDGTSMDIILKSLSLTESKYFHLQDAKRLSASIQSIGYLIEGTSPLKDVQASNMIYSLLTEVLIQSPDKLENKFTKVIDYIDKHYHEVINLKDLSDMLKISPQHFCHIFKEAYHQRPLEYINSVRIQKSKQAIIDEPDMTMEAISKLVGFESPSYFGKLFKKYEKMTPNQFRQLF